MNRNRSKKLRIRMQVLSEMLDESCNEIRMAMQMKALAEAEDCYGVDLSEAKQIVMDSFTRYIKRKYHFE